MNGSVLDDTVRLDILGALDGIGSSEHEGCGVAWRQQQESGVE